jgi:hypothetical protein
VGAPEIRHVPAAGKRSKSICRYAIIAELGKSGWVVAEGSVSNIYRMSNPRELSRARQLRPSSLRSGISSRPLLSSLEHLKLKPPSGAPHAQLSCPSSISLNFCASCGLSQISRRPSPTAACCPAQWMGTYLTLKLPDLYSVCFGSRAVAL